MIVIEWQIPLDYVESERYEASKEVVIRMLREGQFSTEEILQPSEQDMQMNLMCKGNWTFEL